MKKCLAILNVFFIIIPLYSQNIPSTFPSLPHSPSVYSQKRVTSGRLKVLTEGQRMISFMKQHQNHVGVDNPNDLFSNKQSLSFSTEFDKRETKYSKILSDTLHVLMSGVSEVWDTITSAWVNYEKIIYTYDVNGNRTEYIYQTWDGSAWVDSSKCTYTYDANGNLTEDIYQTWDGSAWVNSSKYTYAYDANGNLTEELYQTWDVSGWVNYVKTTFAYDANGNLTEYIYQMWDGSVWVNYSKQTYAYDANGNLTEKLFQTWDVSGWVNHVKTTFAYDANGNLMEELYQTWDGSAWVNSSKSTYTYDANGNYTEALFQNWNGSIWINWGKFTFTWQAIALAPDIKLLSPNAGERWQAGTVHNIAWESASVDNIEILYSTNRGTSWIIVVDSVPTSSQSYPWTIPNTPTYGGKILVRDISNPNIYDVSDSLFWINPSSNIKVISPNGGENLNGGSSFDITYSTTDPTTVKLEYTFFSCVIASSYWYTIDTVLETQAGVHTYNWNPVPSKSSTNCLLRISDLNNPQSYDISDSVFSITVIDNTPKPPSHLTATFVPPAGARLDWIDESNNEDGFRISAKSSGGGIFPTMETPANQTSYSISSLIPGNTYYFKLIAFNSSGVSDYSNTAEVVISSLPAKPTNLTTSVLSSTSIKLSWKDNATNEQSYSIERKISSGSWNEIATPVANTIRYTDNNLSPGTTYLYRIRALNSSGYSEYSDIISATTGEVPAGPTDLQANTQSTSRIDLS